MNLTMQYVWILVFFLASCCAGNRVNQNTLFTNVENPDENLIYIGEASDKAAGEPRMLLKLYRNGNYHVELIHPLLNDEVFKGEGTYSLKNKKLILSHADTLQYPCCYVFDGNDFRAENDTVHKLVKQQNKLVEKYWRLDRLNGKIVDTTENREREPHLIFKALTSRVTGSGGCNGFSGIYEINDQNIRISQVISTKMACMNVPYENDLFRVLEAAVEVEISGDTLKLVTDDDENALFIHDKKSD